jgi:hypothetical protein
MARILGKAAFAASVALCWVGSPAHAKDEPITLAKCEKPLGSIAVVDGDTQGWTKYGLSSPRELIVAMAGESGCFTVANGKADFLVSAIAGDKEEVNRGMDIAKTAVMEGALRSGAMMGLARVPMAGQLMGMFGGLGGKKKTIAAGLRVLAPGSGQTLVSGSGEASKSTITFGGAGGTFGAAASTIGNTAYGTSKDGQLLTSAFVKAFNAIVAQAPALSSSVSIASVQVASVTPTAPGVTTAVATQMYAAAAKGATVRALRAGTTLTPTGKRQGLFMEVKDSYGTQGWVSVEDLK